MDTEKPSLREILLLILPALVFRCNPKFRELTGFSPRYVANLDALHRGPDQRFIVGNKVAYPRESLIRFLEARTKEI